MKARVYVTLKSGILDPQGQAVLHALGSLGYSGVRDVRIGKLIELDLEVNEKSQAEADLRTMGDRLLANPVIEDYRFEIMQG
ncbi:MAG TPA: phosphoribosylformylglycinamidine synthase subunit PurS [Nitrospirales bacterium]|jgi:phosphoribosylformylglycinamidine synthase